MYRLFVFTLVMTLGFLSTAAKAEGSNLSTYILQLSSNLSCDTLDIELISQTDDSHGSIEFTTGAFAAAELPAGTYTFGDVTCTNEERAETFDLLSDKIAPLSLTAGQAYYGGRMIFKQVAEVDLNGAPDVLNNCTRMISKARGEGSDSCRDGTGVDTDIQKSKQFEVFLPEVSNKDIATVRAAMSATKDQLEYLPLSVNDSYRSRVNQIVRQSIGRPVLEDCHSGCKGQPTGG